jgi:hypothetical protein
MPNNQLGHRQMIFWLEGGVLGHSELGHRRINRNELNRLPKSACELR